MATDTILLEVGDTTVPFANYEGDTRAYCRGLADAFRYLGVDTELSEAIVDTIGQKPTLVQKVFLLRVLGLGTGRIAGMTGIPSRSVRRYAHDRVADVRELLRAYVRPIPIDETNTMGDVTAWPN